MISKNPDYVIGRVKFEAQDFKGALSDYSKAIEKEEDPFLYSERAVVYYHLDDLPNSLKDMDYAASLEPENPYRYSSRAYIKDASGDTEGAIADYEKAVALDPEDSIAYNNLGLLQEKLGYKDKAKNNYKRADKLAMVDDLLDKIRKDEKLKAEEEEWNQQNGITESETPNVAPTHIEREKLSPWVLVRNTFTTKSGFNEYLSFIKNGFKSRG